MITVEFQDLKMKEELGDTKPRANSKLSDQNYATRFGSRNGSTALKPRENGVLVSQTTSGSTKDKKSRLKPNEMNKKGDHTSLVFGKVEAAIGVQNGPPVPYLDIPEDLVLTNNKQSVASCRQSSKFSANESYPRAKRSLMADFPRVPKAAQVHPRPSELIELSQLRTLVQELHEREAKLQTELVACKQLQETVNKLPQLENELKMKKIESENFSQRIGQLEAEKRKMSEELIHYPVLTKEIEEARAKIKELQDQILAESSQAKEEILQQCLTNTEKKIKSIRS